MKESDTFGIKCKGYEVDSGAVMARKNTAGPAHRARLLKARR
jgi:hypothetical protein